MKINHGAVWVVVLLGQIIPAVWYGIFQESWMTLNNLTMEDAQSGGVMPYVVSIISSAATAYMLAWVFMRMNVTTWLDGLKSALIIAFPFTILQTVTVNMFSFRPYELSWIDGGQQLAVWVIGGMILGAWTKKAA